MSYDIRITQSDDPDEPSPCPLSVEQFISALESFPPFREHGFTWRGQEWYDHEEWRGLLVDFEYLAPAKLPDGTLSDVQGSAEACLLCISYSGWPSIESGKMLGMHLARCLDAHAWDLSTGIDLTQQ